MSIAIWERIGQHANPINKPPDTYSNKAKLKLRDNKHQNVYVLQWMKIIITKNKSFYIMQLYLPHPPAVSSLNTPATM